jgi:hypothetical protein
MITRNWYRRCILTKISDNVANYENLEFIHIFTTSLIVIIFLPLGVISHIYISIHQ